MIPNAEKLTKILTRLLKILTRLLLLLLALIGTLAQSVARAQVAPLNDPSIAATPSTPPQPSAPAVAQSSPSASVRGWSSGSELEAQRGSAAGDAALDPSHPEIIVFFDTTSPAVGEEFRYRLDGYDADWTVTKARIAHYRRLPPGTYLFRVQARRPGQPWNGTQGNLRVKQRAFFFQTGVAYMLVGCVLLVLAMQVLQQRDQLLKGKIGIVLQERNRIASECHDTLMAGFAAISWQLEATAKLFGDGEHAAAKSCDLARSMVAHCQAEARRIIWDLRDSDEITNSLAVALTGATSTYREREHPLTTLNIHGHEIPISPGAVHHLVCIGQEAVTNAIKHAQPSHIQIDLAYEEDLLRLTVRDDGRGFHLADRSARTGHFGIPVMEERARKLGGTLHLASSAGSGTELSVTVGFHHIHQPLERQHDLVRWIGV